MNAHTPGPWRIESRGSHNPLIETDGLTVAEVLDDCHPDTEQQEANARLIAAAPDLLEYAKLEAEFTRQCDRTRHDYSPTEFREWVEANVSNGEPIGRWLGRIRDAAILKATTGESK